MTIQEALKKHGFDDVDVFSDMNHSELFYQAAITAALLCPNAQLQVRSRHTPTASWTTLIATRNPNFDMAFYRINPLCKPKAMRAWNKPEDVPPEAEWFRQYPGDHFRIVGLTSDSVYISGGPSSCRWTYHNIASNGSQIPMWSDRNRKEWHKCECVDEKPHCAPATV